MVNTVPVAAFDLDGTLIEGQSQAMLMRMLATTRDVSHASLAIAGAWQAAARLGWRGSGRTARSLVMSRYRGRTLAWLEDVIAATIETLVLPALREEGFNHLRQLESDGVRTIIVSASLEPLVIALSERIGASGAVGTRLQQSEGRLGAGLDGPVLTGRHKADAVHKWASRRFGSWRLIEAFGDSRSDIEMLRMAERPVVVNPDRFMARRAARAGWGVVEWGMHSS